ncbi:hypothetical protein BAY61_21565 [Prauserella marina]|uniref:Uncharacterized protein n=1 Tax=Prauserella marina TaxID=530584 RepID=A0A222VTE5_9PSEU|nr:hypothetical protein [Prauserella marina]ASR37150.1 hypothetical protein BAY61_21565 [Prauserella marina]PWV72458.1 hypothetical protein DES30_11056 [Prauserella marina]SDD79608.1 hypothetical protein SAMN05421630_112182 [Prauserella marina]
MRPSHTGRFADGVGVVTLAMGTALTVAPHRTAKALSLGDHPRFARTVGLVDLALASGLFLGRTRWPWMAGRAALNLVLARHYHAETRRAGNSSAARRMAIAMGALTLVDGAAAVALRSVSKTGGDGAR